MRKTVTFMTSEYSGYMLEPFTMSIAEHQFDKALELVTELKEENDKVMLDDIEETLNLNGIDYCWETPNEVINL